MGIFGGVFGNILNAGLFTGTSTFDGKVIIDITDPEALLLRKDADGGDLIAFDTTNNIILHTGNINAANAAGPAIVNAAATATVPTLIPNKAELDTGWGWASDVLTAVLGGSEIARFNTTGLGIKITPTAPLHIDAGAAAVLGIFQGDGSTGQVYVREGATLRGFFGYGDSPDIFTGAIANSFAIRSQGAFHLGAGGDALAVTIEGASKNVGFNGATAFGTSAVGVIAVNIGTPPVTSLPA
jgi:hypothetical protein